MMKEVEFYSSRLRCIFAALFWYSENMKSKHNFCPPPFFFYFIGNAKATFCGLQHGDQVVSYA